MSKKKRKLNLESKLPIIVLAVLLLLSGGIIIYKNISVDTVLSSSENARTFVYQCDSSNPTSIECHQKEYSEIVRQSGIEQAFAHLRQEYPIDNAVKANCHQITHAIGREAADIYGSIDGAYNNGDNFCWSGYYHGVMEAVATEKGANDINNNLTTICENIAKERQYSFYHFNCVHGLGHGLMAINDDELFEVLELCDRFNDVWEQKSCYGGAYMENVMIAIQAGGESKYLSDDQPMYPCTAVQEKYKSECYLMQTSQALRVTGQDYAKVFRLCEDAGIHKLSCYQSLGRDASGNSNSSVQSTISTCTLGQSFEAQENCIIGAVKDFISYYGGSTEATTLCETLSGNLSSTCTQTKKDYLATL